MRDVFWVADHSLLVPSSCGGRDEEALWVSLIRALISFMTVPPLGPNHIPKASLSYTIILGWKILI